VPVQPLEELDVYILAEAIADKWWDIVCTWNPFAKDTVGKQIIRAVDSIGANIAESYGRYHFGDKINLLYYSRGSLYEARFFARRARQRNLMTESDFDLMMQDLQTLAPKLNAYIKSKKQQKAAA
jgi:four helix bundle protein